MDYTVGQLAKQCGLSVRTLHHYESVGLLIPSRRSESGYRLYTSDDVQRLYRILAYRRLGASRKEIEKYGGANAPPLTALLARQRDAAEQEAMRLRNLISLIDRIAASAGSADEASLSLQLIQLMNAMHSIENHFSPAERATLEAMRDQFTPAALERGRAELAQLLASFKAACESGADVRRDDIAGLARRWSALGAPAASHTDLRAKTRSLLETSESMRNATGITPALMAYIDGAVAALRSSGD